MDQFNSHNPPAFLSFFYLYIYIIYFYTLTQTYVKVLQWNKNVSIFNCKKILNVWVTLSIMGSVVLPLPPLSNTLTTDHLLIPPPSPRSLWIPTCPCKGGTIYVVFIPQGRRLAKFINIINPEFPNPFNGGWKFPRIRNQIRGQNPNREHGVNVIHSSFHRQLNLYYIESTCITTSPQRHCPSSSSSAYTVMS